MVMSHASRLPSARKSFRDRWSWRNALCVRSAASAGRLLAPHPNPFNPTTTIELALPVASEYNVAIYNIAGQLIRTYSGYSSAGVVKVEWDGRDGRGNGVSSGVYFYRLSTGRQTLTKKMILLK